jgi:hypothetical protein
MHAEDIDALSGKCASGGGEVEVIVQARGSADPPSTAHSSAAFLSGTRALFLALTRCLVQIVRCRSTCAQLLRHCPSLPLRLLTRVLLPHAQHRSEGGTLDLLLAGIEVCTTIGKHTALHGQIK